MTPFIALALAGLSLATAPTAEPRTSATTAPAEQAAQPNPQRNYCFIYDVTGSILRHKTCKTYSEWMKDGIDPTARR